MWSPFKNWSFRRDRGLGLLWSFFFFAYLTSVTGNIVPSPYVKVGLYQKDLYVGDTVSLTCLRDLRDQPYVDYWTKDDAIFQPNDRIYYDPRFSRAILVISHVVRRDEGRYRCVTEPLKNGTRLISSSTLVKVRDEVSVAWKEGHSASAEELTNVTIRCETTNSGVKLKVLRNGRDVLGKQGRILQLIRTGGLGLDLVLLNIQAPDGGQYTCYGSDGVRTAQANITLNVHSRPNKSNTNLTVTRSTPLPSTLIATYDGDGSPSINSDVPVNPNSNTTGSNRTIQIQESERDFIPAVSVSVAVVVVLAVCGVIVFCRVLRRRLNSRSHRVTGTGGVDRMATQENVEVRRHCSMFGCSVQGCCL